MSAPINDESTTTQGTDEQSGLGNVSESTAPSPAESAPSINPIYQEALNGIPPEFHPKLVDHFKKWDENHQNSLKKWEPFQEFSGRDPGLLRNSLNVWEAIQNDPVGTYNRMREALIQNGQIPNPDIAQQAQQQVAQQQDTLQQTYEDQAGQQAPVQPNIPPEIIKRLDLLEQWAQHQLNEQEQNTQFQRSKQLEDRLVGELNAVQQKWGSGDLDRDKVFMDQVIERLALANQSGRPITAEQAAQQIQTYNDQVIANYVMNRRIAPRVVPANGGIPQEATIRPEDMDEKQAVEYGRWIANGRQGALNL